MEEKIFHLTKGKLHELKKEYDNLVAFEHSKITGEEAPKILESEDLNPEFVSFQEDIESLRGRIDELKSILENYQLIKKPPKEKQVFADLGAKVKVNINGKSNEFMIVGTLEANPQAGKISNESPLGAAILGRKIGEEFTVPGQKKTFYKIKNIKYKSI